MDALHDERPDQRYIAPQGNGSWAMIPVVVLAVLALLLVVSVACIVAVLILAGPLKLHEMLRQLREAKKPVPIAP